MPIVEISPEHQLQVLWNASTKCETRCFHNHTIPYSLTTFLIMIKQSARSHELSCHLIAEFFDSTLFQSSPIISSKNQ